MAIPKQVRKQVEEAEALAKELGFADNDSEGAEEQPTAEVVEIKPEEPQAEEPAAEAPAEPVAAEATAEVVEPEAPAEEDAYKKLEQKYLTLKGKYDAETQALADQNSQTRMELDNLRNVVASLQQQSEEPEQKNETAPTLTPEEVSDYGEELLDVIGRKAMLALNPALDQINQRLQALEQTTGGIQQKAELSDRQKVYAALNENIENWREVNVSDEFKAWLSEADPYVGQPRGALLNQAFTENDATRVVNFFKGYLKEQTAVTPGNQTPSATATPEQAAQVDLETLVSPGGASEAVPASAQEGNAGKVWTQAEIGAFYADVQKGRYKGKDQEKDRIERDIVAAAKEGRVRA